MSMSFRRKPSEFEIEQTIFLGARVSDAHPEFKDWAMMDKDNAFIQWFLEHPDATILDMIKVFGKLEWLSTTTEITQLSMILGTEKKHADVKRIVDGIRSSV